MDEEGFDEFATRGRSTEQQTMSRFFTAGASFLMGSDYGCQVCRRNCMLEKTATLLAFSTPRRKLTIFIRRLQDTAGRPAISPTQSALQSVAKIPMTAPANRPLFATDSIMNPHVVPERTRTQNG